MYGHMDVKHMNSSITKSRKPNEKWKIGAQLGRPVIWRSCDRASWQFDVHVTVHRNKLFIIKSTRCTNFSNFILGTKLYMFWTVPLSIIRSFSLYTQQWYMSYRFADIIVCRVKNSWWWAEELSKTCKVLFQENIWEISAASWFYYKEFNTMHGHMNVK